MRSLMLAQTTLWPLSLPPLPSNKPPNFTFLSSLPSNKPPNFTFLSFHSLSNNSFHNPTRFFPRYLGELSGCPSKQAVNVLPILPKIRNEIQEHESEFEFVSRDSEEFPDIADSATSYDSLLKFMLLLGYLTLQGSQSAVAGTEISSGLQSTPFLGDLDDISTGFASACLLIFFSELGDKTFFIAALLAARNSAATIFTGTFGALAVMTIISVIIGRTFHYVDEILPFRFGETDLPVDDIAAVILLVYFGVSTLIDATSGDSGKAEEEQKEAELAVSEFSGNGAGILAAASTIVSTFVLVFVAEWGDKSFFSTIALAAASSPLGVIAGALAGHGVATLIAVLGGSLLGSFLSEKAIAYVGGVLFLVFAAVTLVEIVS